MTAARRTPRDLGDADEGLALKIARVQGFPRGEPMVTRQDGHERLLQHQFVFEVRLGLVAQKGDVDPSVHKVVGERHRKSARHPDLDAGQFAAQDAGRRREPCGFLSCQESDGENRLGRSRRAPRRLDSRFGLRQREPGMVEKGAAGFGQFDASDAADEKSDADFLLEVADLAAERGLSRVKPLLGGELHALRLGDRDEIAKMPKLHQPLSLPSIAMNIQSLFHRRQVALDLERDRIRSRAQSKHSSRDCGGP